MQGVQKFAEEKYAVTKQVLQNDPLLLGHVPHAPRHGAQVIGVSK